MGQETERELNVNCEIHGALAFLSEFHISKFLSAPLSSHISGVVGRGDNGQPELNDSAYFLFKRLSMMHGGLIIFFLPPEYTFVLAGPPLITESFIKL